MYSTEAVECNKFSVAVAATVDAFRKVVMLLQASSITACKHNMTSKPLDRASNGCYVCACMTGAGALKTVESKFADFSGFFVLNLALQIKHVCNICAQPLPRQREFPHAADTMK